MQEFQKSPFYLTSVKNWLKWRQNKLDKSVNSIDELRVTIADPANPTAAECALLRNCCGQFNLALFATPPERMRSRKDFRALCSAIGLHRIDHNIESGDLGISSIEAHPDTGSRYIPYTSRQLSWHTDGYYNAPDQQVRSWALYCVRQSLRGGDSEMLDHELLYLSMRDEDPAMINAMMQPDAMTIPANTVQGRTIRPAHTGPVFSIDPGGRLHMRYSARTRNIEWKQDHATRKAVTFMRDLLSSASAPIIRYRLQPGEGVISNNALHRRNSFVDGDSTEHKRLLWRARFYDPVESA